MPTAGRPPKPAGQARNRSALVHEWTDVIDEPYDGPAPDLPDGKEWHARTLDWWGVVRSVPHAVLWAPSDWQFALATAYVADAFFATGVRGMAVELRQRERVMGLTADARRALRIRYVTSTPAPALAPVAHIRDPRLRVRREPDSA